VELACLGVPVFVVLAADAIGRRLRLGERGRLRLFDDALLFRYALRSAYIRAPLAGIHAVRRTGKLITLSLRDGRRVAFHCSGWRVEDMVDAIAEAMDALGIDLQVSGPGSERISRSPVDT
jgi:hypothetical protein